MKFGIDFTQPSTLRGIIFLIAGIASLVLIFQGKDPAPVVATAATIAGAMGVGIKDKP